MIKLAIAGCPVNVHSLNQRSHPGRNDINVAVRRATNIASGVTKAIA